MQLTKEEFEEKLREIEKLQDDVEKFLNERNFFVKIFGLKKAKEEYIKVVANKWKDFISSAV